MNERNVAALEAAINAVCDDMKRLGIDAVTNELLASELAGLGVLLPSALTDDQCHTIADEGRGFPTRLRKAAERIAKGDW